jgi:hypothetical protein
MTEPVSNTLAPGEPRRSPLLVRALFVIALLFTLIGLVETAFVLGDALSGGSISAERVPDLELGIRSWSVHHAMRPGYDVPPVRTNSLGLRSPEVAIPKPAGRFRILLLGDSFTFGFRAAQDVIFPRKLEEMLRSRGFADVEVVNAGVLSYCPLLEYLQYKHRLHILEPDLVVLNFDMSDVQDHLEYSRNLVSSSDGVPLFVKEPSLGQPPGAMSGLLSFRWAAKRVAALKRRGEAAVEGVPFVRDEDRYLWALDTGPEMEAEVQRTLAPIATLETLLRHHGIPLLLATYPQPWQVSADATPLPPIREQYAIGRHAVHLNDRPFRALEKFAEDRGLPFVNATDAFRAHPRPGSLFLEQDFHFSAAGHALYAQVLADHLIVHDFASRPARASSSQ